MLTEEKNPAEQVLDNFVRNYFFAVLSEIEPDQGTSFLQRFSRYHVEKKVSVRTKNLEIRRFFAKKEKRCMFHATLAQSLFRNMNILIAPALSY
jgi:hypothetical protein